MTERNDSENSVSRAAAEAERTDDLRKLEMWSFGLPLAGLHRAMSDEAIFLSLSPGDITWCNVQLKSLGLPRTATPEAVAVAAHAGELYFVAPNSLVTVNGTIVARFTPPNVGNGNYFFDCIRQMTRAELVDQVEASRRQHPNADGRHIAVAKGEWYIVVRSDGQAYLMYIDGVGKEEARLDLLYVGHLRLAPGPRSGSALPKSPPAESSGKAATRSSASATPAVVPGRAVP